MTALIWDQEDERAYETGIDRGVLYHLDGSVSVWNGLVSLKEEVGTTVESSYFGGVKVQDRVHPGNYKGEAQAITYPDALDAYGIHQPGTFLSEQVPQPFTLTYREQVSDGSHNIHILGNATFVSKGRSYSTMGDNTTSSVFVWDVIAPRTVVEGVPPFAHIVINTTAANPLFVAWLEEQLYGSSLVTPSIPSFQAFMSELLDWTIVSITEHSDGSWTAYTEYPGYISFPTGNTFQIDGGDVLYITSGEEYEIGDL